MKRSFLKPFSMWCSLKHAETYAYECNICGKGFSRGDYYKRHMKRHAGPSVGRGPGKKKYNFSVKIESSECIKYVKMFIILMFLFSEPVKCKYCLKIFKNVYLLRSHLLSHVKNMRYKCKFCNMTLANTATRFRHQKRHADPNFDLRWVNTRTVIFIEGSCRYRNPWKSEKARKITKFSEIFMH